ncbi:cation transporter, putative [Aspergillus fumigatus Z5]|nr:cation transporter, putative [Aspergillus fumigatus Z5]
MWKPSVNFITLHYAYILTLSILSLIVIYPYGNLRAIDAFFFGASASTESGLNTLVYTYIVPIISNLGFINIAVAIVRLRWFNKRFKEADASVHPTTITFADNVHDSGQGKVLYVPPPWQRDRGQPIVEVNDALNSCAYQTVDTQTVNSGTSRRRFKDTLARTETLERVASSMFVVGPPTSHGSKPQTQPLDQSLSQQLDLPELSSQATIGRNSQFYNLTEEDREMLGGIEYRSLKLLLKIVTGYFFGLHLFGAICLVGWIQHADSKYREYLAKCGQGNVWWGFYSAQTMVGNLGFTLTPDSMISFQDATFPLIVMSFLAYAGNTFYPCLLRFIIWTVFKLCPERSSMKEPLSFLLKHPRRCYTLLFPSKPTWVLFGILFTMNFVDVILIIVLDDALPRLVP